MLDEISRSRRDANRPANNFLSSLDDVFFLPPAPLDLGTGGGRDVRNLNTDPLESPTTSAGPTTVAPPPAPRTVSPSSVGGDAGTDADPASGVAPGPSLGSAGFSGFDIGNVSPGLEAVGNSLSGTPQAVGFSTRGAARGALAGALTGNPLAAIASGLFGGITVADVGNAAVSTALGDDVEGDIASAGLDASIAGNSSASIDGAVGFGGAGGAGSGGPGSVDVGVADTAAEGDVQGGGVGQGGSGIGGEVEGTSVSVDVDGLGVGGDGGDGPSVICTELNRRGLMSDELYRADLMSVDSVPENTVHGYHAWAVPYVRLMRNRWVGWAATAFIRPFAIAWAEHHTGIRPNVGGWLLKHLGQPVCWALGALTGIIDISILYKGDHNA